MPSPRAYGTIFHVSTNPKPHYNYITIFCNRMIILASPCQKSMRRVARLLLQPSLWVSVVLILSPLSSNFQEPDSTSSFRKELGQEPVPSYAASPGHTVFGEYVGAHWCPPCMDSSSPSLTNLKSSNPEEFTYVSFFESSSGGWPNDSPINRQTHIMQSSTGYPTFSFADRQSGSCYKVGSTGTNYYDSDFSNGGCMHASSSDFQLELSMILNSSTDEVTVTLEAIYSGAESSVEVYVYGAVTEKIGADSYDNGVRPHHNWRGWLLDETGTGFKELTLLQGVWSEHTWVAPLDQVRASSGYTQWENFWPVLALMDGPHTSYNEFFAAIDPDMGPMIDVGISEFSVENSNQMPGFTPGDILDLNVQITNNGVEPYAEGGQLGIYLISGSEEVFLDGEEIGELGISESSFFEIQFDTSEMDAVVSGVSTFRAKLTDLGSDRNHSNNFDDAIALHDLPPTPSQPAATGSTSFERGDKVVFEASALPNDLVDDIFSMTPSMEYSKSGSNVWSDTWISDPELVGSGENAVYVISILTPPNAESGLYDTRVMWTDSGGQQSEWLHTSEAFELRNALPRVLGSGDAGFVGTPTVKIDTLETVSLVGLVSDAETPISMLSIDSEDPEFKGWNSATSEISVEFDSIQNDPQGNPMPQGIFVSIDDGEDVNNGMLLFNVIENGAPRWSPITTQPVWEGGSASLPLVGYLSDTDDEGNPVSSSGLSLSVVSNNNEDLIEVSMAGQTILVDTVDDDLNGVAEVVVKADDGSKSSQTSIVFFVINVNDAPVVNTSSLIGITIKSGEGASVDLASLMSDIDDPDNEIWVEVSTQVPGAVQYDRISGSLDMMWSKPGNHQVELTLEDSHGESNSYQFTVSVLDSKTIKWKTDSNDGDILVSVEDFVVGGNPVVTLENVGNVELFEIEVRWSICNAIVGICHSAGSNDGLGSFEATVSSGSGLSVGDYLTLSMKASDQDGWDWETSEILEIQFPSASSETQEENIPLEEEDEGEPEKNQQSGGSDSGFSGLQILVAILILVVFIGGGTLLGLYFSGAIGANTGEGRRNPKSEQPFGAPEAVVDFEHKEENHPQLPEGGLPEGWTMEQWNYYGEQWLERQK